MLAPFFVLAARSPTRQRGLRQAVAAHLAVLAAGTLALARLGDGGLPIFANLLLVAGIVEGAILVGWRLTQLPRSQALEFLLVAPIQPRRAFLGEALVGLALLALVSLSGLPVLVLVMLGGHLGPIDLVVFTALQWTWGAVTGLILTTWAYEPKRRRRFGEAILGALIILYLVVGVLAGEKLRVWLQELPPGLRDEALRGFARLHTHNPFGVVRHWMEHDVPVAWRRVAGLQAAGLAIIVLLLWRASGRLLGHFHERHYEPARDVRGEKRPPVGDRPLAWWAVKRVSEYSGRINLYLAGGFCLLYGAYLIAADSWPAWMGRRIFELCDGAGGPAALTAALVLLAAVPAAFQYGLWDSSAADRCRRLELLLLTQLTGEDYWGAAARAAWARGRGYLLIALGLWLAAWMGGRIELARLAAGVAAGALLWSLYFALGFRAFTRGAQANGLGLLLTVGLPLLALALAQAGWGRCAGWLPPGMVYEATHAAASPGWLLGAAAAAGAALVIARRSRAGCDASLRRWYDLNAGRKVMN